VTLAIVGTSKLPGSERDRNGAERLEQESRESPFAQLVELYAGLGDSSKQRVWALVVDCTASCRQALPDDYRDLSARLTALERWSARRLRVPELYAALPPTERRRLVQIIADHQLRHLDPRTARVSSASSDDPGGLGSQRPDDDRLIPSVLVEDDPGEP
jgi:hypothetical protein